MNFDPNAAAPPDTGIFGLPFTRAESAVVLTPVPFDATTSYRPGTAHGPRAIREASMQVDLYDRRFGRVYERGIFMQPEESRIERLSQQAAEFARPIVARGGAEAQDARALAHVNAACEKVNDFVYTQTAAIIAEGKTPGLVGGEHALSYGAILACAERFGPIGVLQIDAHMDLREAFEGFVWSHASIMHNVARRIATVERIVQVGIRDYCEEEIDFAAELGPRIAVHEDDVWAEKLGDGASFGALCRDAIKPLPERVYVTFDIDGLDPALCPHTGTPVPGGLAFNQAARLLDELKRSGRRIVGFDLVEVAPGRPDEPNWDANVGARVLYKLCALGA